MGYAVFMHLRTTPAWLALSRQARRDIATPAFAGALAESGVSFRYFDAEAFHGRCTDIAFFETDDLWAYYFVVERLRDSQLFSTPYFEVVDIVMSVEEGFRAFEAQET